MLHGEYSYCMFGVSYLLNMAITFYCFNIFLSRIYYLLSKIFFYLLNVICHYPNADKYTGVGGDITVILFYFFNVFMFFITSQRIVKPWLAAHVLKCLEKGLNQY